MKVGVSYFHYSWSPYFIYLGFGIYKGGRSKSTFVTTLLYLGWFVAKREYVIGYFYFHSSGHFNISGVVAREVVRLGVTLHSLFQKTIGPYIVL